MADRLELDNSLYIFRQISMLATMANYYKDMNFESSIKSDASIMDRLRNSPIKYNTSFLSSSYLTSDKGLKIKAMLIQIIIKRAVLFRSGFAFGSIREFSLNVATKNCQIVEVNLSLKSKYLRNDFLMVSRNGALRIFLFQFLFRIKFEVFKVLKYTRGWKKEKSGEVSFANTMRSLINKQTRHALEKLSQANLEVFLTEKIGKIHAKRIKKRYVEGCNKILHYSTNLKIAALGKLKSYLSLVKVSVEKEFALFYLYELFEDMKTYKLKSAFQIWKS